MKWLAILKIIAEILANLPFNASEDTIKAAVVDKISEAKTQNKA